MNSKFAIGLILGLVFMFVSGQVLGQKSPDSQKSTSGKIQKIELVVTGMSCQKGCADGIDKKLSSTPGIIKSKTNFSKSKSVVSFDPNKISVDDIIDIIEDRGYKSALSLKNL